MEIDRQIFHLTQVLTHPGTSILVAGDGPLFGAVTLHVLPNLTYGGRPYALIENVITDQNHRGRGIGRNLMNAAIDAARDQRAYKVMLLTGQARAAVTFYEKLGFSADEKTGMILRLEDATVTD
jgi:GNAT superfamily N-acetyltransferase